MTNGLIDTLTRAATAATLAFVAPGYASADEVLRWNQVATAAAAAGATDPLTESRIFAMVHVAIHDAVNAIEPRYEPYLRGQPRASGASPEAAAAAAAHDTLVALLPAGRASFDAALQEALGSIEDGAARSRGLQAGRSAARAILAARRDDGADRAVPYQPGSRPGDYRPTPPDFTPAFGVQWGRIDPFVLVSPAQFRPPPPPKVESAKARRDVEEVRRMGAAEGSERNEEQSEIARFWYENSPQGWNRIAREVASARKLDLLEDARLFALVNLAMADGFIAGFEAKYHYEYWRPATAIREDGDGAWLSYLPTPPVPDHPSTHTVLGAAAATVLARYFGTDFVPFSMTSGAPYPGIRRRFWSFSEAARENGASRVLAGIHFASAVSAGYAQGGRVGTWTFERALRPAASRGAAVSASSR